MYKRDVVIVKILTESGVDTICCYFVLLEGYKHCPIHLQQAFSRRRFCTSSTLKTFWVYVQKSASPCTDSLIIYCACRGPTVAKEVSPKEIRLKQDRGVRCCGCCSGKSFCSWSSHCRVHSYVCSGCMEKRRNCVLASHILQVATL